MKKTPSIPPFLGGRRVNPAERSDGGGVNPTTMSARGGGCSCPLTALSSNLKEGVFALFVERTARADAREKKLP